MRRSVPPPSMHPHLFTVLVAGFLLCVALLGVVHHARANGFVDMIHVICIPEAGLFEFSGVRIEGQQSIRAVEENPEEMSSKYGLYDPNNYIDFESVPTRFGLRTTKTRKASARCDLGENVVDVLFEPEWLAPSISYRLTVHIDGRLVVDDLRLDDQGGDSTGIGGFTYNAGSKYIFLRGILGPTSRPYLPAYNVGNIFEFGPGIPPLRDYKTVFERLVDGLEPPKSRRLPRSGR